jgi:hypothetical protein
MKNISKYLTAAVFVSSSAFLGTAHADNGFYLGGSLGNATIERSAPSSNVDVNSDDTGYKVYGGFKFTVLAVEGGYVDFGSPTGNNNTEVELSGFDLFGLLNMGIGPVDLFGKVGAFSWDSEDIVNGVKSESRSGTDPAYGIGAGLSLGSFSVRAEYEYFDMSDFENVTMFSIGGVYTF